jgi:hypothetical protein
MKSRQRGKKSDRIMAVRKCKLHSHVCYADFCSWFKESRVEPAALRWGWRSAEIEKLLSKNVNLSAYLSQELIFHKQRSLITSRKSTHLKAHSTPKPIPWSEVIKELFVFATPNMSLFFAPCVSILQSILRK